MSLLVPLATTCSRFLLLGMLLGLWLGRMSRLGMFLGSGGVDLLFGSGGTGLLFGSGRMGLFFGSGRVGFLLGGRRARVLLSGSGGRSCWLFGRGRGSAAINTSTMRCVRLSPAGGRCIILLSKQFLE